MCTETFARACSGRHSELQTAGGRTLSLVNPGENRRGIAVGQCGELAGLPARCNLPDLAAFRSRRVAGASLVEDRVLKHHVEHVECRRVWVAGAEGERGGWSVGRRRHGDQSTATGGPAVAR
jgi:hypothetical protein